MKRRYPLDALQKVRRQAVDDRAREVAELARRTAQAETEAQRAAAARRVETERARRVVEAEQARVEEGAARVADLAQSSAWHLGAALRQQALGEAERQAHARMSEQRGLEARARDVLAGADADAKAVEKHRERWDADRAAADERAAEEAASEAWSGRRRGGRRT